MPKALLLVNVQKVGAEALAQEIASHISKAYWQCDVVCLPGCAEDIHPSDYQLCITLGGDGTVLYASRILASAGVPVVPINFGTFGFITEVSKDDWLQEINSALSGDCHYSQRIMLKITVSRGKQLVEDRCAMNEVVVSGAGISKLINLSVGLTDSIIGSYRADGVIVATPTGSTAYSAAAGGPILTPELDALILTPICPFTLSHRPLVFPAAEPLNIVVDGQQRTEILMTIDGQEEIALQPGDVIQVGKADYTAKIMNSHKRSFYEVLRSKLNWTGGNNA